MVVEEKVIKEVDGKVVAELPEDFKTDEELQQEEEVVETEEEEPEEKEEEESTEEKEEEEEEIKEDVEEEVKEKYVGKTAEELVKMLEDRDVTIGKQGTKIREYEETDPEKLSKEEIKARLSSEDIRSAILINKKDIRAARQKLDELDSDIDGEETVKAAQKELEKLEDADDALTLDLSRKISDETINRKFASQDNAKFLSEKKAEFKDKLGIEGDEFDAIIEASKGYIGEDGRIDLDIIGKGMIDLKGLEGVAKLHEIRGNTKARKEIVEAIKKGERKISTTSKGGKSTRTVEITDDMSMHETKRIVKNLSDEELFGDNKE